MKNLRICLAILLFGFSSYCFALVPPADVTEIVDNSVQSIWATNELAHAKVDLKNIKSIVDISFPCKIIYQDSDMVVHVLRPESSGKSFACLPSYQQRMIETDHKVIPNSIFYCAIFISVLSVAVNVISYVKHKNTVLDS